MDGWASSSQNDPLPLFHIFWTRKAALAAPAVWILRNLSQLRDDKPPITCHCKVELRAAARLCKTGAAGMILFDACSS
jgi:hypothetical protein